MAHRYYTSEIDGDNAYISGGDAVHLARVLRMQEGGAITLCDGAGSDYESKITDISAERISLRIVSKTKSVGEPSIAAHVYVAMPKGDKLEFIIQKAVELGAVSIHPFFSEFTAVKPKNEQAKIIRRQRIADEAAKQCARGVLAKVFAPIDFTQMLKEVSVYEKALIFHQEGGIALPKALGTAKNAAFITGAEGGFSNAEIQKAHKAGCTVVGLGPRILRCETAPVAVLSAAMLCTGNLQPSNT